RNAELEAFAYSISHDLRAPLRAMQGFSLALLEDYGDRLDEAGRRYAQRVITAARTMDRLIDDLLAYSRLARAELRLVPIDLGRLVRSSLEQLDGEVQGRGARITVAEPLPVVVGHGATLGQVFVNLLANGIKFVPELRRAPEAAPWRAPASSPIAGTAWTAAPRRGDGRWRLCRSSAAAWWTAAAARSGAVRSSGAGARSVFPRTNPRLSICA